MVHFFQNFSPMCMATCKGSYRLGIKKKKVVCSSIKLYVLHILIKEKYVKNSQILTSDGSGTRNLGFGFWKYHGEMGLRQVEQGFSSYFATFLAIFDDFSK